MTENMCQVDLASIVNHAMSKRKRPPRKDPLQSEAKEDATSLASLLSLAPGENECNRITWHWDVYKAFQQDDKFRRLYTLGTAFGSCWVDVKT